VDTVALGFRRRLQPCDPLQRLTRWEDLRVADTVALDFRRRPLVSTAAVVVTVVAVGMGALGSRHPPLVSALLLE
jgi:hypothetical protein